MLNEFSVYILTKQNLYKITQERKDKMKEGERKAEHG